MIKKTFLFVLLFSIFSISCTKKSATATPTTTVITNPKVLVLQGGIISTPASLTPFTLNTNLITTEIGTTVKDGYQFKVESTEGILFSVDNGLSFESSKIVESTNGKLSIISKTPNKAGSYKLKISSMNSLAQCYYFLNIVSSSTANLGEIKFSSFQDLPPYNKIKDENEPYILLADGNSISSVTIGPIKDSFFNDVGNVKLRMTTDKGSVVSENPVIVTEGTGFFSLQSDTSIGTGTVIIEALDSNDNRLFASMAQIEFTKPILHLTGNFNFGNVFLNTEKEEIFTLKNDGGMTATNLNFIIDPPFNLRPDSSCLATTVLRPGEECQLKTYFVGGIRSLFNGNIRVTSSPTSVSTTSIIQELTVHSVAPANLSIVDGINYFDFATKDCGLTYKKILLIKNVGDIDATGITVTNPDPIIGFMESFYRLELPPADSSFDPDLSIPSNCGNIFPAGRTCKVDVIFNPMKLTDQSFKYAHIGYNESSQQVSVSIAGIAQPGEPAITIPVDIKTPLERALGVDAPIDHILLNDSQVANVYVGPIKDICGNIVKDGTEVKAMLTAGTMSLPLLLDTSLVNYYSSVTNNGQIVFGWKGSNSINDIGIQTITLKSGSISKSMPLTFDGIKLNITGATDLGQILTVLPKSFIYTITNSGTIDAHNISINYFSLSPLDINNDGVLDRGDWASIDPSYDGGCADGVLEAGASCTIKLLVNTKLFKNGAFSGKIHIDSSDIGKNTADITIGGRSEYPPVLRFEFPSYNLGILKAGQPLLQTMKVFNDGPADANLPIFTVSSPYIFKSTTCGTSVVAANSSCYVTIELTSHIAGSYSTVINFLSEYSYTSANVSITVIPDNPGIIPIAFDKTTIPSDTNSKIQVTVGPIQDIYFNTVNPGTQMKLSTTLGKMSADTNGSNTFNALTDSNGYIKFFITSRTTQEVGNFTLTASFLDSNNNLVSSASQTGTLQGSILKFDSSTLSFPDVVIGNVNTSSILLHNNGNVNATNISFNMGGSNFSVLNPNDCKTIIAGGSCTVQLSFFTTQAATYTGTLRAFTTTGYGQLEDIVTLNQRSFLPAKLTLTNPLIEVSLIPGSPYSGTIILKNDGYESVSNVRYSINQNISFFNINMSNCSSLASQASCSIPFTFTPSNGGSSDFTSLITFSADSPTRTVSIDQTFIGHVASLYMSSQLNKMNSEDCSQITVKLVNSSLSPIAVTSAMSVNLSSNLAGSYYSNSSCTGTSITSATIPSGQSSINFIYFKPTFYGSYILSVSNSVLATGNVNVTVNGLTLTSTIINNSQLISNINECEKINVVMTKSDGSLYSLPNSFNLTLSSSLSGSWWGDNTCSTMQISAGYVVFSANANNVTLYYKPSQSGNNILSLFDPSKIYNTNTIKVYNLPNLTINTNSSYNCSQGSTTITCPNSVVVNSSEVYLNNIEKTVTSNITSGSNSISVDSTTSLSLNDLILIKSKPNSEFDWTLLNTSEYFRITQIVNATTLKVANLVNNGNPTINQSISNKVRLYVIPEFYNIYYRYGSQSRTSQPNLSTGAGGISGIKIYNKIIGEDATPSVNPSTLTGSIYGDGLSLLVDGNNTYIQGGSKIQTRTCSSQPAHSTGGNEISTDGGATWSGCQQFSCSAAYSISGNTCVVNAAYCSANGGIYEAGVTAGGSCQFNNGSSTQCSSLGMSDLKYYIPATSIGGYWGCNATVRDGCSVSAGFYGSYYTYCTYNYHYVWGCGQGAWSYAFYNLYSYATSVWCQ